MTKVFAVFAIATATVAAVAATQAYDSKPSRGAIELAQLGTPGAIAGAAAQVAAPTMAKPPAATPEPTPIQQPAQPAQPAPPPAATAQTPPAVAPAPATTQTTPPATPAQAPAATTRQGDTGNVIFFHPDGTSISHWQALRMLTKGPDGTLEWDLLPESALYSGHMSDALTGTSNGGATVHAYGVKVQATSFGLDGDKPIIAASGRPASILQEALAAGKATGLVQTGHIAEPGTAAFIASVKSRRNYDEIARQVVQSGVPVILGGGEAMLLPKGIRGVHGDGSREDGLDLVAWAKANGYTVVYTREELAKLDLSKVDKLLGLFARWHTFNDQTEEKNASEGLGLYQSTAPTVAEMSAAALKILSRDPDGFMLVVEEEGTDNFGNTNNAPGTLEALRRADETVGLLHAYVKANPNTLLLMAADSDAGGMQVIGPRSGKEIAADKPVPKASPNGAPLDGVNGTGSLPFLSAPDKSFKRWPFAIAWATDDDVSGAIMAKAAGRNAGLVKGRIDNTGIYRVMYRTLFGRTID